MFCCTSKLANTEVLNLKTSLSEKCIFSAYWNGKAEFLLCLKLRISAKYILRFSVSVACEIIFPSGLFQCFIVFPKWKLRCLFESNCFTWSSLLCWYRQTDLISFASSQILNQCFFLFIQLVDISLEFLLLFLQRFLVSCL